MGNARPSVTKKQREQVKRERQRAKEEKRAQRKIAGQSGAGTDHDSDILDSNPDAINEPVDLSDVIPS